MTEQERFDRAIERLTADESPRDEAYGLTEDEQKMLRFAQVLRGTRQEAPRAEFVNELHTRLFSSGRVSRRTAFFSAIGTLAAGILGGLGIERAMNGGSSKTAAYGKHSYPPLVGQNGKWTQVATIADVPSGSIRAFTAGSVQGFLMNRNGEYRAMSRICTHMGCALRFDQREQYLICPCHGATFDIQGKLRSYKYGIQLPPLPAIHVRVRGEAIEVFAAGV